MKRRSPQKKSGLGAALKKLVDAFETANGHRGVIGLSVTEAAVRELLHSMAMRCATGPHFTDRSTVAMLVAAGALSGALRSLSPKPERDLQTFYLLMAGHFIDRLTTPKFKRAIGKSLHAVILRELERVFREFDASQRGGVK